MRLVIACLGVAALVAVAAAELPHYCAPGRLDRVVITRSGKLVARGKIVVPPGFAPTTDPATLALAYEPETDAANDVLVATLPSANWKAVRGGLRYRDPAGSAVGIRSVRINRRGRVTVQRAGDPIAGLRAGAIRITLAVGAACGRTCGAACVTRKGGLRCRRGTDARLCGVMSGCELLGASEPQLVGHCLTPFPSDFFNVDDPGTPTGKRHAYRRRAMPINKDGVAIDPTPWNTLDGFSPGAAATAHFPRGIDLAASAVPPITDVGRSLDPASPTLLIEADAPGCVRVLHFGENDVSQADAQSAVAPPAQAFLVRPAVRLKNATRYIVALRHLVGQDGLEIAPPGGFAALVGSTPGAPAVLEARRPHMETILAKLAECGVARDDLVLAWDFTTASDDALERWLLHMRDETFAALGTSAPSFAVTSIEDDPFGDPRICRRVRGVYTVPLYTTANAPGSRLNVDPATNLPVQTGVATNIPFTAVIPCSLVAPVPHAGRPILYGHGLLGTGEGEIGASNLRALADTYGFVLVATDWQGMASEDVSAILGFLDDLSDFPILPERLHQGILNQLVLARLIGAADGLSTDPAFAAPDGMGGDVPLIDASTVYFYGNSMGGVYGGTFMALSQEIERGVIGVGAANFTTLLQRSEAFGPYAASSRTWYPAPLDRIVSYPLVQELWDRADPNGWYHHTLVDPLPGTPVHTVLLHMATNDPAVPNLGTIIMARSMGLPQVAPAVHEHFGMAELAAPIAGSAFLESDGGYDPVPTTNTAPGPNPAHEAMRALPAVQAQIDAFLRPDGVVQQFCAGPCDPE